MKIKASAKGKLGKNDQTPRVVGVKVIYIYFIMRSGEGEDSRRMCDVLRTSRQKPSPLEVIECKAT